MNEKTIRRRVGRRTKDRLSCPYCDWSFIKYAEQDDNGIYRGTLACMVHNDGDEAVEVGEFDWCKEWKRNDGRGW